MKNCEYCKILTNIIYYDDNKKMYVVECEDCYAKNHKQGKININLDLRMNKCDICLGVGNIRMDLMKFSCVECKGIGWTKIK